MKKIRIERVSIGSIAVTILLGILLVFVSSECTQQFAALQTATDEYIECENQASELQAASDYLAGAAVCGDRAARVHGPLL